MRDHPLMENSVASAPLLVRSGVTYTKLAVTLTPVSNGNSKLNATVLHLGTGEKLNDEARKCVTVCVCVPCNALCYITYIILLLCIDHGELHIIAVVGPNATLLQEVPLFPASEPINNILLYKVNKHKHI